MKLPRDIVPAGHAKNAADPFSDQQEAFAHKQHSLFHEFDGALKDKDFAVQALKQELVAWL